MKIGTMFGDILQSFFRRPATQTYPVVRYETPARLRGKLVWSGEKCTGCALCVKDCPSNAIEMIVIDKTKKQFVMRYHIDRCTFCAQCVHNCRFKCIEMSQANWELASLDKDAFTVHYGEHGNIQALLAGPAPADSGAPA
jgi:formate hydrogenlyase subunit 6/NADH:ubiquinone oxidoreductase subunit I